MTPERALLIHVAFEWAGMLAGARMYLSARRNAGAGSILQPRNYAVLVGCLFGAALGNKAAFWLQMPHLFNVDAGVMQFFLGGQSMVGGLLGGLIGVEIAKKLAGIAQSTGDSFVFPILLGLMIGRIGCYLAGLQDQTYGLETVLPWGVDFGDGIKRHPTQLYEIIFVSGMWMALRRCQSALIRQPGLMFKLMLSGYLSWRFLVDSIKPVPYVYPLGLSGIQWLCLVALVCYTPLLVRQWRCMRTVSV